jgi:hypothetical protein
MCAARQGCKLASASTQLWLMHVQERHVLHTTVLANCWLLLHHKACSTSCAEMPVSCKIVVPGLLYCDNLHKPSN